MDCKKTWAALPEEKKKQITQVAVMVGGGVLATCVALIYLKGFKHGACKGADEIVQWIDKTIPETKVVERLTDYVAEHPGKLVWKFGNILDEFI